MVNAVSPTRRSARFLSILAAAVLSTLVAATAAPASELSGFTGGQTPVISGSAVVGSTLTATVGTLNPTPTTETITWIVGGVTAATGPTYVIGAADLGKTVVARHDATAEGYEPFSAESAATAAVGKGTQSFTPTISGTVAKGYTLTAKSLPTGATLSYRWKRNGSSISGATSASYKLTSTDIGKNITVTVTSVKPGYTTLSKTSAATAAVKKVFTYVYSPVVTGTAKVGYTLKATTKAWSPLATLKYQWYRNGVAISGATSTSRKLSAADQGAIITVKVTGYRSGYLTLTRTSKATAVVAKGSISAPTPTITGTRRAGSTLKVSTGTVAPSTVVKTYQWLRNGVAIPGATGTSLALKNVDAGKKISVKVTYTATGYSTKSLTSALTATISTRTASMVSNKEYSPSGSTAVFPAVAPGVYLATGYSEECYWVRDSDHDGGNGVIVEYGDAGRWIVEIAPTDGGFYSIGCGSWIKYDGTGNQSTSITKNGFFGIGVDIKPGIYTRTGGSGTCYATLESDALNVASSIVGEYDVLVGDSLIVDPLTAKFFTTWGCGTWTRTGDVPVAG